MIRSIKYQKVEKDEQTFDCLKGQPNRIINSSLKPNQDEIITVEQHFENVSKLFYNTIQKANLGTKSSSELRDFKKDCLTLKEDSEKTNESSAGSICKVRICKSIFAQYLNIEQKYLYKFLIGK